MSVTPVMSGLPVPQRGFTLIESAIVLVVIGLILAIGALSWQSFAEARRFSKARSQLLQMKDCLVRGVVFTEHYPRQEDFEACRNHTGKDPWGTPLKWIVGFTTVGGSNKTLNATHAVVSDAPRAQTAVWPISSVTTYNATGSDTTHSGVAFILISLGKNCTIDNAATDDASYEALGPPQEKEFLELKDFSHVTFSTAPDADDQFLLIKGYELAATIKHAVGP